MVQKLKIAGKEHPIRISYYALKHTALDTGKSLSDLGSLGEDPETYESLLFYGLKVGASAENVSFSYEKKDMEMILDECFFEFIEVIKNSFPAKEDAKEVADSLPKKGKSEKK